MTDDTSAASRLAAISRYAFVAIECIEPGGRTYAYVKEESHPEGHYVKWADVEPLLTQQAASLASLTQECDELRKRLLRAADPLALSDGQDLREVRTETAPSTATEKA